MAYIINSLKLSVICILLMATATSCVIGEGNTDPGFVDIVIAIPDSPKEVIEQARHGVAVDDVQTGESQLTTLTFIVFNNANVREEYREITINPDNTSSDPMWEQSTSTMRLVLVPGQKTIYVVANWSLNPTTDMPDLSLFSTPTTLETAVRTHTDMVSGVAPVMSGKLASVTVAGGDLRRSIILTRQIARVDVYPLIADVLKITEAKISLEGIKFIKLPQKSYLFPQTPIASPVTATWDQPTYKAGTSGVILTATTQAEATTLYSRSYIPEYIGESASSATTMLIKAKYNGQDTYYKIVLQNQQGVLSANQYKVERNHIYEYYVTIVGQGSDDESFSPSDLGVAGVANVKYVTEIR